MKKIIKLIANILAISLFIYCFINTFYYSKYDVNKDGTIDVLDLLEMQKYLIENRGEK